MHASFPLTRFLKYTPPLASRFARPALVPTAQPFAVQIRRRARIDRLNLAVLSRSVLLRLLALLNLPFRRHGSLSALTSRHIVRCILCDKFNRTAAFAISFCYRRRNFAHPCHLNLSHYRVSVSPRPPKFSQPLAPIKFHRTSRIHARPLAKFRRLKQC